MTRSSKIQNQKSKIIIGLLLVICIFVVGNFFRRQYVVPIAMYHSVNPEAKLKNRLEVSVKHFEGQMRFLKKYYNVVPLEHLADFIRKGESMPYGTLAITFDDGYKDTYVHAFPILKKYINVD